MVLDLWLFFFTFPTAELACGAHRISERETERERERGRERGRERHPHDKQTSLRGFRVWCRLWGGWFRMWVGGSGCWLRMTLQGLTFGSGGPSAAHPPPPVSGEPRLPLATRDRAPLRPYSRTMPGALWKS